MSTPRSFRKEEIADKTVIDSSGRVVGKVKDLTFTLDSTITLIVERTDGSTLQVPLNKVMGVSDHVIIKEETVASRAMPTAATMASTPGMVTCKFCGTKAPAGTQWCPNCGRSIS